MLTKVFLIILSLFLIGILANYAGKLVEFIKNNEGLTIPEIENFAEISNNI